MIDDKTLKGGRQMVRRNKKTFTNEVANSKFIWMQKSRLYCTPVLQIDLILKCQCKLTKQSNTLQFL